MYNSGTIAYLKREARYLPSSISAFVSFAQNASRPVTFNDSSAMNAVLHMTSVLSRLIEYHT